MKLGSREFMIVGILVILYMLLKGSTKSDVVVVDQGPRFIRGPPRPVFIRPWGHGGQGGHGGHGGQGGHGGHGGHHHQKPPKIPIKPPKIPVIPIKPPKIPIIPIKPPEPFMNNLRPPPPGIPVQSQRWS